MVADVGSLLDGAEDGNTAQQVCRLPRPRPEVPLCRIAQAQRMWFSTGLKARARCGTTFAGAPPRASWTGLFLEAVLGDVARTGTSAQA